MESDCEVEVDERHIRARRHDEQAADALQRSFFITPSKAYSAYWRLLRRVDAGMWDAGERHRAGGRERSVVCVELRGRGVSAKLLVVLEKTPACLLVVTAYPHGGCSTHYVISAEELLREATP